MTQGCAVVSAFDTYLICLPCALTRQWTVRQLIAHAFMLRPESVCGHYNRPVSPSC